MKLTSKKGFIFLCLVVHCSFLNFKYLAETKTQSKTQSIIKLICLQNFKDEMLKANIKYNDNIAQITCKCYLDEFRKTSSHQKAINKCKRETREKFNL